MREGRHHDKAIRCAELFRRARGQELEGILELEEAGCLITWVRMGASLFSPGCSEPRARNGTWKWPVRELCWMPLISSTMNSLSAA